MSAKAPKAKIKWDLWMIVTVAVSLCTKRPSDEAIHEAFDKPIEQEV